MWVVRELESTKTTLSESEERQLLADLQHMQTASIRAEAAEKLRKQTGTTQSTTPLTESVPMHWWERYPSTNPPTRPSKRAFTYDLLRANLYQ